MRLQNADLKSPRFPYIRAGLIGPGVDDLRCTDYASIRTPCRLTYPLHTTALMSQYQPNAAPGRSFIEKINSKFSSITLGANVTRHVEKDGNKENDTLIHHAFVKYFDHNNLPYPEWLGAEPRPEGRSSNGSRSNSSRSTGAYDDRNLAQYAGNRSQYQPVRTSYNSISLNHSGNSQRNSYQDSDGEEKSYTRRSNSKLQAMYNRSRQQNTPGSGYTPQGHATPVQASARSATNLRLRDRVMNTSSSFGGSLSSRTTRGK